MNLDIKFPRKFYNAFQSEERYNVIYGSAGSGKSYNMFLYVVMRALAGEAVLVAKDFQASISGTVWAETVSKIYDLNLQNEFVLNKTERLIKAKNSAGEIKFVGSDYEERLKSLRPTRQDCFSLLILEEATSISKESFDQLTYRQRGTSIYPIRCFLLMNPVSRLSWIFKMFFEKYEIDFDFYQLYFKETFPLNEFENVCIMKTTWRDNKYIGDGYSNRMDSQQLLNPRYWNIYSQGNFGVDSETIYDEAELISLEDYSKIDKRNLQVRIGADLGWTDPTCFVFSFVDFNKKIIYIVDDISRSKSKMENIATEVKGKLEKLGLNSRQPMRCDSNDPRSADILKEQGLNVTAAVKGGGSVFNGILYLKEFKIFVLESCVMTWQALQNYCWEKNSNGEITDKPNHNYSHIPDAWRYSFENDMRNQRTTIGSNKNFLR